MSDPIDLQDPKTKEELTAVMKEISHEMHIIETARDQIKEIVAAASDAFDIEKGLIRKVSRFYHKKSIAEYETEATEVKNLYTQIVNPSKTN